MTTPAARMRSLFGFAVWASSIAAAWWLYNDSAPARGSEVAIVQAKEHRVAAAHLLRVLSLDVVEGQRVESGQALARLGSPQRELPAALTHALEIKPVLREIAYRSGAVEDDQTILRATANAHVAQIHARPSDLLRAGEPVVTLGEAPREAIAYVDERRGSALPSGTSVLVKRRGAPGEWRDSHRTRSAQCPGTAATPVV